MNDIVLRNCIWLLSLLAVAQAQCPSGWMVHDDSCYLFSHDTETWEDAKLECKDLNAYLVEIGSARENSFLENGSRASVSWIGANDIEIENEWKWAETRSSLTYTNWKPNEPNNIHSDENCAEITSAAAHGLWNDRACHTFQNYICEKGAEQGEIVG